MNSVVFRDNVICFQFRQKPMFDVYLFVHFVLLASEDTFKRFHWHILNTQENKTSL